MTNENYIDMRNILTTLVADQVKRNPDRVAYRYKTFPGGSEWEPTTWVQLQEKTHRLACRLADFGIGIQDKIAIFSANRPEILISDFAAYALRAVPVSIYATSSADEVKYIVNDSGATILFVGNKEQYEIAKSVAHKMPKLKMIVTFDDVENADKTFSSFITESTTETTAAEVAKRTAEATADDIATLIYTSGTTGEPKGAILTHSNFDAAIGTHQTALDLDSNWTALSFLPLSHIFEKAWTYLCLSMGIMVYINNNPKDVQKSLRETRPNCMCSVPRFWEKAYAVITDKMAAMPWYKRAFVNYALRIGKKRNIEYVAKGLKAPRLLEAQYTFFNNRVFMPLRRVMGMENGCFLPTAGAPLSPNITEFFHAIGINLVIGYGLSETTATVSFYPATGWQLGTVGKPLSIYQIRIGENNEIQLKSPTIMRGYHNKPEETRRAFTTDGWFRTGDAGELDPETGAITLTERLKDLFKTSNGKYIAPQVLETRLGEDKYIEQVAIIADKRKYVTAIITPAFEAIAEYARKKKIQYQNFEELVRNSEIIRLIQQRIDMMQRNFASFEQIKRFTLIPREFSMELGELTNTLKIRRPVVNRHFACEIEAMYM